eukprot:TRINITY_DN8184_c1_g1_i1.p1 TRINITY_DN8184_c1_g1~~TRINITY_DN8184_c1_g1_i1.p1  ORF type:complete len:103 (-),score=3.72 TRINITY_DN8184_c1_g1_i1:466-774(-)
MALWVRNGNGGGVFFLRQKKEIHNRGAGNEVKSPPFFFATTYLLKNSKGVYRGGGWQSHFYTASIFCRTCYPPIPLMRTFNSEKKITSQKGVGGEVGFLFFF